MPASQLDTQGVRRAARLSRSSTSPARSDGSAEESLNAAYGGGRRRRRDRRTVLNFGGGQTTSTRRESP